VGSAGLPWSMGRKASWSQQNSKSRNLGFI
jgi:hypothetical protein